MRSNVLLLWVSMEYELCHAMFVSWNRRGLDLAIITAKCLGMLVLTETLNSFKYEMIVDNAILAIGFWKFS